MAAPKLKNNQLDTDGDGKSVSVKRIKPFPFQAQIVTAEGTPPQTIDVVKMNELGLMIQTRGSLFFKVGSEVQISFELPVLHTPVQAKMKIIKTYDILVQNLEGKLEKKYTVEMHFKVIEPRYKDEVFKFLQKIKPKTK